MTRKRSILAVVVGALGWAAVTACNQQTIQTPTRSFDRPSDLALVCAQYYPDTKPAPTFGVRPLGECDPNLASTLSVTPNNIPDPSFFVPLGSNATPYAPFLMALVTQSARGELALVDTVQNRLVDVDPRTPGFNFLPVGKLPEHARATSDGCLAVTANSGSCDYGIVDVPAIINKSVLDSTPRDMAGVQMPGVDLATGVRRVRLVLPGAPGSAPHVLQARPSWIEIATASDDPKTVPPTLTTPGQCIGGAHSAWVALPACQLVVKMSLDVDKTQKDAPNVLAAVRVTRTGASVVPTAALSTLDCPVECGTTADPGSGGSPDLSLPPSDMGATTPTQAYPTTIAVDNEGGRLIIGDLNGERVDILPLDVASGQLGAPRHVQLESGAGGVRVVRVGPRSQAGKFLYAIARDGTVRVVDLDREVECETNPDPRFPGGGLDLQQTPTSNPPLPADPLPGARQIGCFPLTGDPKTQVRRAPLATSPGITLSSGQLPADIAFVHAESPPPSVAASNVAPPAASPGLLVGDFAWIVSSDGRGTVVNIYDACPQPNQQDLRNTAGPFSPSCALSNVAVSNAQTRVQFGHPEAMLLDRVSHRLRAGNLRFAQPQTESDPTGQPRVSDELNACTVAVPDTSPGAPDGGVPDGGTCNGGSSSLPGLYAERIPAPLIDPTQANNPDTYPLRIIRFVDPDRARNETWVLGWEGVLPGSDRPLGLPQHGQLVDPGGQWCSRGVLAGDKLEFRGCTVDSDCDQAAQPPFQCVHDPSAFSDVTQGMCLPIDNQTQTIDYWSGLCGKLLRAQRKYRITSARQAVQPGTDDTLSLAEIYEPEYAEQTAECKTTQDCIDKGIQVAPVKPGLAPRQTTCLADFDGKSRCLLPCDSEQDDSVCGPDFECAKSAMGDTRCMRAPINDALWSTCFPERQEYQIRVGDAFLVGGTSSGTLFNETPDGNGECIVPAESSPMHTVRERQARIPLTPMAPGGSTPLICPPMSSPLDSIDPALLGSNVCIAIDDNATRVVHYENPVFNIALQASKQGGTVSRVIVPPDGTSISFTINGGGNLLVTPIGVDVQAQQPRYVAVAPDQQTVYIVDEGKSTSAAGLRGQLLRLFTPTQSVDHLFIVR